VIRDAAVAHPPGLPPRLRAIADAVPARARSVADIGAGDGQLSRHLAARGLRVIATESRPGPFARLRAALPGFDCRFGQGLEVLQPGEVEGAVIAGMGGRTIARILEASPQVVGRLDWLILQPQQHPDHLQAWLEAAGYGSRAQGPAVQGRRRYTVVLAWPHERS
jgi:tRNA (adenine22-N1)-methyltransferase